MKAVAESIKTTVIGGFLVILPIYVSLLLVAKGVQAILTFIKPIIGWIPASLGLRHLLAALLLGLACFLTGLIVRTGLGERAKKALDRTLLQKLPGYSLARGLVEHLTGHAEGQSFTPALAEIEEALVPALIIEELSDGSYTVLVPSVPTPMAGAIYVLSRDRVHPVDVPLAAALRVFSRWGVGMGDWVRAMRPAEPSPIERPLA
jgi:uncharacterized membrane protein